MPIDRETKEKRRHILEKAPRAPSKVVREDAFLPAPAAASNDKSKLTLIASAVTGTRFCSYHQGYAEAESGTYLLRNRTKRWMCGTCLTIRGIATSE